MNIFLQRYKDQLGKEYPELEKNLGFRPLQSIRVNTLKIKEEELVRRLQEKQVKVEKISWLKNGYDIIKTPFNIVSSSEYLQGYFFIQEKASQLPVKILNPKPEDLVLDCCAAPGAKTTQIAQEMQNKGRLVAMDFKQERIYALKNNMERCGVKNAILYHHDARNIESLGLKFDKILVDAPCSGNFTQEKDWFSKRKIQDVEFNVKKQKTILQSAINSLKPKGTLVYSTCSLETEEDEGIIEWALKNFEVKAEGATKLWPHRNKTQGFFAAKLKKSNP